jgi:glucosamine kinase
MSFYLGIDAGGTKTACVLGNEERVLVRAVGGSIKPLRVTPEEARENLKALLEDVVGQAGTTLQGIAATAIGIAGLRFPETRPWLTGLLESLVSGAIDVCGDEEIALDGAFQGRPGVLLIAGTGSNILARTSKGELLTVGGWGPALGDEGSGYWIGHEALSASFRAYDRGEPAPLLEKTIAAWSAKNLQDVVAIGNRRPFPDFSLLAPLVVECAQAGDPVCRDVLVTAGHWLAEFAARAYRKLLAAEGSREKIAGIAFIGSIVNKVKLVRETMLAELRSELPDAPIFEEEVDGAVGALWRARRRSRPSFA